MNDISPQATQPPETEINRGIIRSEFILHLQNTKEIPGLWEIFLHEISANPSGMKIKQAGLVFKVGVMFENHRWDSNGISSTQVTEFSFCKFCCDFDYILEKTRVVVFNRIESDCIQLEIEWEEPGFNGLPGIEKDKWIDICRVFINQLQLVLKIKNFEYHAVKDDITLAFNQNYLKAFIQNEMERARRYATVFSIAFFDLDNLKAVNDAHGHLVGTEILKEVAMILRAHVRKVDILSRFGGDEFVIVLLHADAEKALEVCSRIKTAIKNHDFLASKNLNIKISGSFGISSFPGHGNTVDEMIRKADIAMYDVKRTGKDGIKIYEGD